VWRRLLAGEAHRQIETIPIIGSVIQNVNSAMRFRQGEVLVGKQRGSKGRKTDQERLIFSSDARLMPSVVSISWTLRSNAVHAVRRFDAVGDSSFMDRNSNTQPSTVRRLQVSHGRASRIEFTVNSASLPAELI
jgi:hypothetical protein